jgi:hypothetical protein
MSFSGRRAAATVCLEWAEATRSGTNCEITLQSQPSAYHLIAKLLLFLLDTLRMPSIGANLVWPAS